MRVSWLALLCIAVFAMAQTPAPTPQDAQALEARGDWPGAENDWRAITRAHPNDYRFWTSLGISLAHQNKWPQAINAYRKALALHPHSPEAEFNLGLAYFKSGNLEKAVEPLKDAAAQMPGSRQIDLVLGMCLYGTGKYAGASPYLDRALADDPANKELRFVLAQAYLGSGEYEKAKTQFQAMLERDPDSAQVHMLLGEAYDGLGNTDEAIAEFRSAAKESRIPDAHFGLGYLLWKTHKYPEAVPEFKAELTLDSTNHKALAYLGDTELKLGEVSAAKRDLSAALALHDTVWITRFDLGKIAEDEKRYDVAEQNYEKAVNLDPDRPEAHYRLAQVFKAQGNEARASAEFAAVTHLHERKSEDLILKVTGKGAAAH